MELRTLDRNGLTICPVCDRHYRPDLEGTADFGERIAAYRAGALIQDVWPHATGTQREQIMTGTCSDECWNASFPDEEP